MNNNIQIPKGYKPYKTIDGKFAAHIGPYYIKYKYPRTVFIVFIDNKLSNLNEIASITSIKKLINLLKKKSLLK